MDRRSAALSEALERVYGARRLSVAHDDDLGVLMVVLRLLVDDDDLVGLVAVVVVGRDDSRLVSRRLDHSVVRRWLLRSAAAHIVDDGGDGDEGEERERSGTRGSRSVWTRQVGVRGGHERGGVEEERRRSD